MNFFLLIIIKNSFLLIFLIILEVIVNFVFAFINVSLFRLFFKVGFIVMMLSLFAFDIMVIVLMIFEVEVIRFK